MAGDGGRVRSAGWEGGEGRLHRAQAGSPWILRQQTPSRRRQWLAVERAGWVTAACKDRGRRARGRKARAHRSALRFAWAKCSLRKHRSTPPVGTALVRRKDLEAGRDRAASRATEGRPEESLQPAIRPPNPAISRRISARCQGRPDWARIVVRVDWDRERGPVAATIASMQLPETVVRHAPCSRTAAVPARPANNSAACMVKAMDRRAPQPSADHRPLHGQAGRTIGAHHALDAGSRVNEDRLAGGAGTIRPVAAVAEQKPRDTSGSCYQTSPPASTAAVATRRDDAV